MASSVKDAGWFYHAPARPKVAKEPVPVPPASQIPGLSDLSSQPFEDETRKMLIKESDSPYIRLAKTGGRPDLLRHREPKPPRNEAVGYPKVDWYYLDDNAMEDNQNNERNADYQFMLPDYMVHVVEDEKEAYGANCNNANSYTPNRLPYAYDKQTIYEREGKHATDKNVRLEESRPAGYGVRKEHQQGKHVKYPAIEREIGKAPESEMAKGKKKIATMHQPSESERPIMGKVLSYGYAKDWEEQRDVWKSKQKPPAKKEKHETSEYQSSMMAGTPPVRSAQSTRQHSGARKTSGKKVSESNNNSKSGEKELFKLSKLKSSAERRTTPNKMSSSAPWATSENNCGDGPQHRTGGKKTYDFESQKQDAPFAQNYPETSDRDDNTPRKGGGRRRYAEQDAAHESPYATNDDSPFKAQPKKEEPVVQSPTAVGRQKPIKPSDNSSVFRYDNDNNGQQETHVGKRRIHQNERSEAPFATDGGADQRVNGNSTPRSAGGRRRYDDKLQQKPAPFAVDDGVPNDRFQNIPAKTDTNRRVNNDGAAGAARSNRNVPPPNSAGVGLENASSMKNSPFAMN